MESMYPLTPLHDGDAVAQEASISGRYEQRCRQLFAYADSTKESNYFIAAAKLLESGPDEKKKKLPGGMYNLLNRNKEAFIIATTGVMAAPQKRRGRNSAANILRILKATMKKTKKLTDDQELYLKKV